MLPPEYLQQVADDAERLYIRLNQNITNDICRRIVKTGTVTDTAQWQIKMLQESAGLMNDIITSVSHETGISEAAISKMFVDAGIASMRYDAAPLLAAGINAGIALSPAMRQIIEANIRKTNGDLLNLTQTTAATGQDLFVQSVTEAAMKVESGAFSYDQAIRQAVDRVSDMGATVMYRNGNRVGIEAATRMNVLTSVSQTVADITLMNCEDLGTEYVEVSAHHGARPTHQEWQGEVYHIGGATKDYDDFEDATGYGMADGLCGINCRHSFFPFFPDVSQRAYTREYLDHIDDKVYAYDGEELSEYEASQTQRRMEREIRQAHRRVNAYDASVKEAEKAGNNELADSLRHGQRQARDRYNARRGRLTDFCNQTGREKDYTRTRVSPPTKEELQALTGGR